MKIKDPIRVADVLICRLADLGVRHIFLLTGGGAMHLNDAVALEDRIEAVPCQHEQACGICAEAYGRAGGRFGVALVTSGPGATNILTPVIGAWIESLPMLVISGQVKRADRVSNSGLRQRGVQEVDIIPSVSMFTKYAVTINQPSEILSHLEAALYWMTEGRPGPVWIEIPLDVQASFVDPRSLQGYLDVPIREDSRTSCRQILAKLETALKNSQRPVFIVGQGIRTCGAVDAMRCLVERMNIPCLLTWNALDILPWDHPLNAGRPGVVALRGANFTVQNSDLVISLGCRLDNVITAYNQKHFAARAVKFVVDIDPSEIEKLDPQPDHSWVGDAKMFIEEALISYADSSIPDFSPWVAKTQALKRKYPLLEGQVLPASGEISHYHCVEAISKSLPPDCLAVTGSSGLAVEAFYVGFKNKVGQRIFNTGGIGAMGYGLPAVIGAALAAGSQKAFLVEGDGSFMLNLQELATLKSLDLPITILLINNGGYASIRNTQRNYFSARYIGSGVESGVYIPNLVQVAQAFGIQALCITSVEELEEGLRRAVSSRGPVLCEIQVRNDETLWPKVTAIPQTDGSIISMPLEDMSPLLPIEVLEQELLVPPAEASYAARGLRR